MRDPAVEVIAVALAENLALVSDRHLDRAAGDDAGLLGRVGVRRARIRPTA